MEGERGEKEGKGKEGESKEMEGEVRRCSQLLITDKRYESNYSSNVYSYDCDKSRDQQFCLCRHQHCLSTNSSGGGHHVIYSAVVPQPYFWPMYNIPNTGL